MFYTPDIIRALNLCLNACGNKLYAFEIPLQLHIFYSMDRLRAEEPALAIPLRYAIENGKYSQDDLRASGFEEDVVAAAVLLACSNGALNQQALIKIRASDIARLAAIAEFRCDLDCSELGLVPDEARASFVSLREKALRCLSEPDKSFIPHYDKAAGAWRVDFKNRDPEEGDLLYVFGEYAETALYYPFNTKETIGKEYCGHGHSFEGVLRALLRDPEEFSIAGYEDLYSAQERKLLEAVQQKLASDKDNNAS